MIREEIKSGVNFTAIEGDYKKSRLEVALVSPLSREIVTPTALLPYMLERGTKKCPDMTAIKRRLNALYGTNLMTSYASFGFSRVIGCVMSGADGSLLNSKDDVSQERAQLLLDILLDPHTKDGGFDGDWLDIEREKLRETINAQINDKANYCFKLLNEQFYKGDDRAFVSDGYVEDLDKISAKSLRGTYQGVVKDSSVEIVYVGPDTARFKDIIQNAASRFTNIAKPIRPITPIAKNNSEIRIVKQLDVEQDKLSFAFTTGEKLELKEQIILRVAVALFGGTPTSRLFQNVREKQSLCYSISASPSYESGGGMFVECGIEHKNVELTRNAVMTELNNLIKNGITKTEFKQVKLLYENVFGGIFDNTASIAKYEFNSILRNGKLTDPAEEYAKILSVTEDEVVDMLSRLTLNCSCQLCKKEGN